MRPNFCTHCRHFQPPDPPKGAGQCLAVSLPAITARAQACGTFGHLFEAAPLHPDHPETCQGSNQNEEATMTNTSLYSYLAYPETFVPGAAMLVNAAFITLGYGVSDVTLGL